MGGKEGGKEEVGAGKSMASLFHKQPRSVEI